jgi:hypothetical protein
MVTRLLSLFALSSTKDSKQTTSAFNAEYISDTVEVAGHSWVHSPQPVSLWQLKTLIFKFHRGQSLLSFVIQNAIATDISQVHAGFQLLIL